MPRRKNYLFPTCLVVLLLGGLLAYVGCGNEKSTSELIDDLKSDKENDRITAVRNLPVNSEDAEKVVPALIEALKDKQGDIRLSAAIKLGVYGEKAREAIPALRFALNDHDARVRRAAANALTKIAPDAAKNISPDKSSGP